MTASNLLWCIRVNIYYVVQLYNITLLCILFRILEPRKHKTILKNSFRLYLPIRRNGATADLLHLNWKPCRLFDCWSSALTVAYAMLHKCRFASLILSLLPSHIKYLRDRLSDLVRSTSPSASLRCLQSVIFSIILKLVWNNPLGDFF